MWLFVRNIREEFAVWALVWIVLILVSIACLALAQIWYIGPFFRWLPVVLACWFGFDRAHVIVDLDLDSEAWRGEAFGAAFAAACVLIPFLVFDSQIAGLGILAMGVGFFANTWWSFSRGQN